MGTNYLKEVYPMSDLTPDHLVEMQIADIRLAAAKMSGRQRRNFIAEMSLKYSDYHGFGGGILTPRREAEIKRFSSQQS